MDKTQFIAAIAQEQESLRRFLQVLCKGDAFTADDLAQEALLKAYLSFQKFEGRSKFSTWLMRIAYNCFYDYIRKQSGNALLEFETVSEYKQNSIPDSSYSPEAKFEYSELYMALENLSGQEKAITVLFYMEEKSIKEIEVITQIPSGTIRSHLSRARAHLREYLDNK